MKHIIDAEVEVLEGDTAFYSILRLVVSYIPAVKARIQYDRDDYPAEGAEIDLIGAVVLDADDTRITSTNAYVLAQSWLDNNHDYAVSQIEKERHEYR